MKAWMPSGGWRGDLIGRVARYILMAPHGTTYAKSLERPVGSEVWLKELAGEPAERKTARRRGIRRGQRPSMVAGQPVAVNRRQEETGRVRGLRGTEAVDAGFG